MTFYNKNLRDIISSIESFSRCELNVFPVFVSLGRYQTNKVFNFISSRDASDWGRVVCQGNGKCIIERRSVDELGDISLLESVVFKQLNEETFTIISPREEIGFVFCDSSAEVLNILSDIETSHNSFLDAIDFEGSGNRDKAHLSYLSAWEAFAEGRRRK